MKDTTDFQMFNAVLMFTRDIRVLLESMEVGKEIYDERNLWFDSNSHD